MNTGSDGVCGAIILSRPLPIPSTGLRWPKSLAWAGHYDENTLDNNAILGPWVGGLENFHIALGFSGHGLMQAPAVGRGLSELLLHGRYQTLDLSRLGYRRILDGIPLRDEVPKP